MPRQINFYANTAGDPINRYIVCTLHDITRIIWASKHKQANEVGIFFKQINRRAAPACTRWLYGILFVDKRTQR